MTDEALARGAAPLPQCEPGFGPSPGSGSLGAAGAAESGGHRLGVHVGPLSTRCMGRRGSMHPADMPVPQNRSAQIPGFTERETCGKCTQGKTFVKWIFLPLFSVHPRRAEVGHVVNLKALSLPRLSRRSAGSTTTRRGPCAITFYRRSAEAQPQPGENEALI